MKRILFFFLTILLATPALAIRLGDYGKLYSASAGNTRCATGHAVYMFAEPFILDGTMTVWGDITASTSDLTFDEEGLNVVSGVEGFHSKAFGPYDDLYGIIVPEVSDVFGIKRGTQAAQKADTRKAKLEKVQEYASALKFSRAILG